MWQLWRKKYKLFSIWVPCINYAKLKLICYDFCIRLHSSSQIQILKNPLCWTFLLICWQPADKLIDNNHWKFTRFRQTNQLNSKFFWHWFFRLSYRNSDFMHGKVKENWRRQKIRSFILVAQVSEIGWNTSQFRIDCMEKNLNWSVADYIIIMIIWCAINKRVFFHTIRHRLNFIGIIVSRQIFHGSYCCTMVIIAIKCEIEAILFWSCVQLFINISYLW